MRCFTLLLTASCLALALAGDASAKSALRWKLDIKPDESGRNPSGRVHVTPNEGPQQTYWFFVYTIKNTHDEAVPLQLHIRAETDASELVYSEGYYPRALARIRNKYGDDVKDNLSLQGYEIAPGETVRAVAVYQFRRPDSREFEERMDRIKLRVHGYADPVKKIGSIFMVENLELWMHYEKKGDQFSPNRESVTYVGSEESVVE
ncbi:MAG: hypothetical protein V2A76_02590 [Planctomycetota bacterium]